MGSPSSRQRGVYRVVAAYAVFAALWILLSDHLLGWLVQDPARLVRYAMYKGWAFVAVTSVLLYVLVQRQSRHQQRIHQHEIDSVLETHRAYELLAAVAEHSEDLIFALDTGHRYRLVNKAACELVGLPAHEILDHGPRDLFPPEVADKFIAIGEQVLADGVPRRLEQVFPGPSGPRTYMAIIGALRGPDHELIGTFGVARDMTERQRAEQALRASEATYHTLVDNLHNGLAHCRMIFDGDRPVDYEILRVNPAHRSVTGLDDVVGRRMSQVLPGYCEENPESLETFARVARTGEPMRWEHFLVAQQRWYSFSIFSPAPGEFVLVSDNITERKRAEAALADSEARFRRLFEHAPIALATSHRDGHIGEVNREFMAMLGYDRAEIATIDQWRQRVLPDEAARQSHVLAWQRQWAEPAGTASEPVEQVWVCKNGTRRTVLLSRLNLGEDMLVSGVDITARKAAEEELRLRVEELERFNQASVGRELDMIEMKRTVNALSAELGRAPPHALEFLPTDRRGVPR